MKISKLLLTLCIGAVSIPALAYGYGTESNLLQQERMNIHQQEAIVKQQKQIVDQQMMALRQQERKLDDLRRQLRFDESNMHRDYNHNSFDKNPHYFNHP